MSVEYSFKSLTSSASNELLQSHNSLTFKLLKTGEWPGSPPPRGLARVKDKFFARQIIVGAQFHQKSSATCLCCRSDAGRRPGAAEWSLPMAMGPRRPLVPYVRALKFRVRASGARNFAHINSQLARDDL